MRVANRAIMRAPRTPQALAPNRPFTCPRPHACCVCPCHRHGLERRGLSPAHALAVAQIAPQLLADPASRITAVQMERVSGAAMQALDDEGLGWFSRRLPWCSACARP